MKRTLLIVGLVLLISTSMIAGTLSAYSIKIDDLAKGSVVAKEFILLKGDTITFEDEVKIAPGDIEKWQFSVKNYDDKAVSETAMDLDFLVTVAAADGKSAIEPLEITVEGEDAINEEDIQNNIVDGVGTITITDEFPLEKEGQEKTYTVNIEWPWATDDVNDIDYAGSGYGTTVTVSVTGTQKK